MTLFEDRNKHALSKSVAALEAANALIEYIDLQFFGEGVGSDDKDLWALYEQYHEALRPATDALLAITGHGVKQ